MSHPHPVHQLESLTRPALEWYMFGKRGRPRVKGIRRPLHGLEGAAAHTDAGLSNAVRSRSLRCAPRASPGNAPVHGERDVRALQGRDLGGESPPASQRFTVAVPLTSWPRSLREARDTGRHSEAGLNRILTVRYLPLSASLDSHAGRWQGHGLAPSPMPIS